MVFGTIQELEQSLARENYLVDHKMATVIFLALRLQKPLLVEGAAGVGKTALAQALARVLHTPLLRLQCYEGLDEGRALFEWNYQKQLLRIQSQYRQKLSWEEVKENVYDPEFLLPRPLLQAILAPQPVTLLLDEVDKSDEEFESFLLELLSDFQVSIPELGTVQARSRPMVLLTSNNQRQLSDALRRRCLYLYLDFPDRERELAILRRHLPDLEEEVIKGAVDLVQSLRRQELKKPPSVAETLDLAASLAALGVKLISRANIQDLLGIVVKNQADLGRVQERLGHLLPEAGQPYEQ